MVRRVPLWSVGAILVLMLLAGGRPALAALSSFAALPAPAQAAISAALGRDDRAYHARAADKSAYLANPRHHVSARLTPASLTLRTGPHTWGLRYLGIGYGTAHTPAFAVVPTAQANRVEYRRGPVTEWYVNGPEGLEQGFTLAAPPGPRTGSRLALHFALSGTLRTRLESDGSGLILDQPDGRPRLAYRGLTAVDATGRALPARLTLQDAGLTIEIDDANARYPLTIDPVIQEVKLTTSDGTAGDLLGYSVAVSGDTVVLGAPHASPGGHANQGAVYVFAKSGESWESMTESAKLTASDGAADDRFGVRVAISTSGDTIVVGAFGQGDSRGAAYVFVKPGGGWSGSLNQSAKLVAGHGAANDAFGLAVAVNASGDTVVVGAPTHPYNVKDEPGTAYTFNKPASGWNGLLTETTKLTASNGTANDFFGFGVAINASGDTIVAGAFGADVGLGAAYVFTGAGNVWTQQATLTATDRSGFSEMGVAVAINGLGDTIVAGAWRADVGSHAQQGAAYVYTKPATGWTDAVESAKLVAADGAADDYFGFAVALSGDTVVVGAYNSGAGSGAAYVFNKPASGWSGLLIETTKLTGGPGSQAFGIAAAVQGSIVIVGSMNAAEAGGISVSILSQTDPTVTLSVTKAGTGTGTVTSNAAGISCGTTCSVTFTTGTTVTLTATPATGSTFTGWSGNCSGSDSPTTVTMTADRSCTATFALNTPTLSIIAGNNQSGPINTSLPNPLVVKATNSANGAPVSGATVTWTVSPVGGGTLSAATTTTGADGQTQTTLTLGSTPGPVTVTAKVTAVGGSPVDGPSVSFTATAGAATLTVTKAGTGTGTVTSSPAGISCGADCSESYAYNTTVTLTATPATGSTFTGWSGACTGTGGCTVAMTAARSVTATFALHTHTLTYTAGANGSLSGPSPQTVAHGGSGTAVTAVPNTGYVFTTWSDGVTTASRTDTNVQANITVTASFAIDTYTLTVTKAGTGTGTVTSSPTGINCGATCSASFTPGTTVVVTATADAGSTFTGWSGDCVYMSVPFLGYGVTMNANKTCTATFTATTSYALTVTKTGTGSGTVTSSPAGISCGADCNESYAANTAVSLTATPDAGSTFASWSGDCSGTGGCPVTMTAVRSVTATFTASTPFTVLHNFTGGSTDGDYPHASLVQGATGILWGTTANGGASNLGTAFKLNTDGSGFALLHTFTGGSTDGANPRGSLQKSTDGAMYGYGTTSSGGASNLGTIFKANDDGSGFALLHTFTGGSTDGATPLAGVIQGADGMLYGTTSDGGLANLGTIFKINPNGSGFTLLHSFVGGSTDGQAPKAQLIRGADGALYGTTSDGGTSNAGTVFKLNTDGTGFTLLHEFAGGSTDGFLPLAGLLQGTDGALYGTTAGGGTTSNGTVYKINSNGSGFTLLHDFAGGGTDGAAPYASLIQGSDGALYGTTQGGGTGGVGTVFKLNPDGSGYSLLYSFGGTDGGSPLASLLEGIDGALYGTTSIYGSGGAGTVFRLGTPATTYLLTVAKAGTGTGTVTSSPTRIICGATCTAAFASGTTVTLTATPDAGSTFTSWSGDCSGSTSPTTVTMAAAKTCTATFTATLPAFALLHSFAGGSTDGANPFINLIQGAGGALYGTTYAGGTSDLGTVFKLNGDGSGFTLLHSFAGGSADGANPYNGLTQGADGALYGTTYAGGTTDNGTVFRLTPDGTGYTVLHLFAGGSADGANPYGYLIQGTDNALYGMTWLGGTSNLGTIFKLNPDGSGYTVLHSFVGGSADGANPYNGLTQGADGALYGTTRLGGTSNLGTIFKLNPDGSGFTLLHSFAGGSADGANPYGYLIQGTDNALYGMTWLGGTSNLGTIFKLNPDGSGYTVLHSFVGGSADGAQSDTGLIQGADGALYGTTYYGATSNLGTIFKLNPDGSGYTVLHLFAGGSTDGARPEAGLLQGADGALYGTTRLGGTSNLGTVFRLGTPATTYLLTVTKAGTGTGTVTSSPTRIACGATCSAAFASGASVTLTATPSIGAAFTGWSGDCSGGSSSTVVTMTAAKSCTATFTTATPTFTLLHIFAGGSTDGSDPRAGLIQDTGGILYGTTSDDGIGGVGTVFKLNPDGTGFSLLHEFTGVAPDGAIPKASLIKGTNGMLYGTTDMGGTSGSGTVFRLNPDGTGFLTLREFAGTDGTSPVDNLLQGWDGRLYGTTATGGTGSVGTVFALNPDGTGFTLLHSFAGGSTDGDDPDGGLIQGADGALYGTTYYGGTANKGTVFKLQLDGTGFSLLHSFAGGSTDGAYPDAGLIQGADGALYGTTYLGGTGSSVGTVFKLQLDGTGFSLLHSFAGGLIEGEFPRASLLQGADGALYGTTSAGGTGALGTVFKLNPNGTGFLTLHEFAGGSADGAQPRAGLLQGADGAVYGTTGAGGAANFGTIFKLQ